MKSMVRLFGLVLSIFVLAAVVFAQEPKTIKRNVGSNGVEVFTFTEIPDATEPCSPAECEWWNQLRLAANDVGKSGGRKSLERYVNLFAEGLKMSYRVPLKDRPAQSLVDSGPITKNANEGPRRNGTLEVSVEVLSDGSVGEVKVLKSLGTEIDRHVVAAIQIKAIYLTALRYHAFVSETRTVKFSFWSQGGIDEKKPTN